MDKLGWIKDLVRAEVQMEESGVVDFSAGFDPESALLPESIHYLNTLKSSYVDAASAFNQLKGAAVGRIKIYGISKTHADFMLFRNGYKMIFTLLEAGKIAIRFHHLGSTFMPGKDVTEKAAKQIMEDDLLIARWGAFGNLIWTFSEQPVQVDYMVRYYLSRFIRESAK